TARSEYAGGIEGLRLRCCVGRAYTRRLERGSIRAGYVESVHHDVAGAEAVDGGRQVRRPALAVYIDHERGIARIVETLPNANTKECRILSHQALRCLSLHIHSLAECGGRGCL